MKAFIGLGILLPVLGANGPGAPECPCVNSSYSMYSTMQAGVVAKGAPSTYGLTGCANHDMGLALYEGQHCDGSSPPSWCNNNWCFVDESLCPENVKLCEAAGGVLGSDVSPYCRTRATDPSSLLNNSEAYSYQTCGSVNDYDTDQLNEFIAGRSIRAAADAWAPWIVKDEEVWSGPTYEFFVQALSIFEPKPVIEVIPGWATQESRDRFPSSSYTACVHDVAVGNFDICIADLWLTPERNKLVTFLPAVRCAGLTNRMRRAVGHHKMLKYGVKQQAAMMFLFHGLFSTGQSFLHSAHT